jgi:gas vesicle protein GvpA/GvpJ/GvpM family
MTVESRSRQSSAANYGGGHQPANLGDILERVLDRGLVIVGDIRVSLLDIELLTIKLRLLIASVDTARELGINWWQHDPWLTSEARPEVRDRHREAVGRDDRRALTAEDDEPRVVDGESRPRRRDIDAERGRDDGRDRRYERRRGYESDA